MANTPLSVDDYRARVAALIRPVPVTLRPALDCVGLVLAEDLVSPVSLPPFDNSAMDGYAVRAEDVADAERHAAVALPVPVDIPAGRTDIVPLLPHTAHNFGASRSARKFTSLAIRVIP